MRLTVVICTWNRATLLRETLRRMLELETPEATEWELLVVNNNCSDETDEVVAAFEGGLPLRLLHEPRPGKSHALNRALDEARGEYLIFTDDDVLVEPDWLRGYTEAFGRHPEAAVFGGPIHPWFEGEPPAWLVEAFHQVEFAYAALDHGTEPVSLDGRIGPFGANMAVRTEDHRRFRYDPDLGPRPGSGLRGEETALVKELFAHGASGFWVPEAKVRHHIPVARQTTGFVREWYRGWGEYLVRTRKPTPARIVFRRPVWLWREVVASEIRYRTKRAFAPSTVWIEALKETGTAQGMFRACGEGVGGSSGGDGAPPRGNDHLTATIT